MKEEKNYHLLDVANSTYLTILQGVINRMANNSLYCKIICVTFLPAIIVSDMDANYFLSIAVFIILLTAYLDLSYLSLERVYVKKYNDFVNLMRENNDIEIKKCIYDLKPTEYHSAKTLRKVASSWSVWIPYLVFLCIVIAVYCIKLSLKCTL